MITDKIKTPTLQESLSGADISQLKVIAAARGIPYPGSLPKTKAVEQLSKALGEQSSLQKALDGLSPGERQALEVLIANGGVMASYIFWARFGLPSLVDHSLSQGLTGQSEGKPPHLKVKAISPAEALLQKGLVFQSPLGIYHQETVYIPRDILVLLPKAQPPAPTTLKTVPIPREILINRTICHDILTFLSFLRQETVRPVRTWQLSKKHLIALNNRLGWQQDLAAVKTEEEASYILFLHRLLIERKLITLEGQRLMPTAFAREWLAMPPEKRLRDLWESYKHDSFWNELAYQTAYYNVFRGYVVQARARLLATLKMCPVETWISFSSFADKMLADDPAFLRSGLDFPFYYFLPSADDEHSSVASWHHLEGRFLRAAIFGPLFWLGIVAIDREATAFQITPVGAALLGIRSDWPPEPGIKPIIIQPNFEIVVPLEANLGDLFRLEEFAELIRRDMVSIYRLSMDAIWNALESGDNVTEIVSFLERASNRALPQNVAYSLQEWAKRYGEIRIGNLTVLTTARESLLQELQGSRTVKLIVQETLGPTAVAIAERDVAGLIRRLRKAGYLPKISINQDTAVRPSGITLQEDELALLLAAARLAERDGAGRLFPEGLLDRLERNLSASQRAIVYQLADQIKDLLEEQRSSAPKRPAARFATANTLPRLEQAIKERLTIDIEYYEEGRGQIVRRRVDPYRLESRGGVTYLIGYSHWHQGEREFMVDQIRTVLPTGKRYM